MTINTLTTRTITSIDGGGSAICAGCRGSLDYSWRVTYSDGGHAALCSICLEAARS